MAYKNKLISNPKTGQTIRFLKTAKETRGQLLEMETIYESLSKEPPAHYHPGQDEDFMVKEGTINVKIDGVIRVLRAGDSLHIKRNVVHSMWNGSYEKAVVNWKVQPALESEYFFENMMGLAAEGKTNNGGMPNLLQVALVAKKFSAIYRLARPPFWIQKILFGILTPVAYIKGLRPVYQKYLD